MEKRKSNQPQIRWQKENYSRIPLDVEKPYHAYLKEVSRAYGMTLGSFIKAAITEKIARDGKVRPYTRDLVETE